MAGGEFRFGTDSIYMARHQHRPPESTSAKIWITWLHYGCVSGAIASLFNTIAVFRRGKLGLVHQIGGRLTGVMRLSRNTFDGCDERSGSSGRQPNRRRAPKPASRPRPTPAPRSYTIRAMRTIRRKLG